MSPKRHRTRYTADDLNTLMEMLENHRPYQEIAAVLERNLEGVKERARAYGTGLFSANGRTQAQVAALMGVHAWVVMQWIAGGHLTAHRVYDQPGPGRGVIIEDEDLLAFLEDQERWHLWDPERISDRVIREWAAEKRRGLRYLTIREAAARVGYSIHWMRRLAWKGEIPTVRAHDRGFHMIREDWLQEVPYEARS
jgi:transposase